jgi:hypothetical protein
MYNQEMADKNKPLIVPTLGGAPANVGDFVKKSPEKKPSSKDIAQKRPEKSTKENVRESTKSGLIPSLGGTPTNVGQVIRKQPKKKEARPSSKDLYREPDPAPPSAEEQIRQQQQRELADQLPAGMAQRNLRDQAGVISHATPTLTRINQRVDRNNLP